jgi:hypothetical protein
MTKNAKNSDHLQIVDLPKTTTVQISLPLLEAFANIENSFFELCIDAGQQVLGAMMEQDREELCGPRWKRDPERSAGRTGTTRSEVTLGGRRIPRQARTASRRDNQTLLFRHLRCQKARAAAFQYLSIRRMQLKGLSGPGMLEHDDPHTDCESQDQEDPRELATVLVRLRDHRIGQHHENRSPRERLDERQPEGRQVSE